MPSKRRSTIHSVSSFVNDSPSDCAILKKNGYTFVEKLGSGSFADVFLCEFKDGKRKNLDPMACKVLDKRRVPKNIGERFAVREVNIMLRIDHPHIIRVYSIYQRADRTFIFMRFAENGDLEQYIGKHGPIAEDVVRIWVKQLALAIQYLHLLEISHRDIKCENVLVTAKLNVKLTDFGFGRCVIGPGRVPVLSSTFCGSLSYAAPEIIRGIEYNGKISDMWSFGVLVYFMLNRALPFPETNHKQLQRAQLKKKWSFRPDIGKIVSSQAKQIVSNCLEPNTKRRWRANDIIRSNFLAMDPRLKKMTSEEYNALAMAMAESSRSEGCATQNYFKEDRGMKALKEFRQPNMSSNQIVEDKQILK